MCVAYVCQCAYGVVRSLKILNEYSSGISWQLLAIKLFHSQSAKLAIANPIVEWKTICKLYRKSTRASRLYWQSPIPLTNGRQFVNCIVNLREPSAILGSCLSHCVMEDSLSKLWPFGSQAVAIRLKDNIIKLY